MMRSLLAAPALLLPSLQPRTPPHMLLPGIDELKGLAQTRLEIFEAAAAQAEDAGATALELVGLPGTELERGLNDFILRGLDAVQELGFEMKDDAPSLTYRIISELREDLRVVLLEERIAAIVLLLAAVGIALVGGLTRGTAGSLRESSGALVPSVRERQGGSLFRTELTAAEAAVFDAGGASMPIRSSRERLRIIADAAKQTPAAGTARTISPVSPGLWLELLLCVALDVAGDASLFYPFNGELADVGFAVFSAFCLELFFDWPALALFGLWEEALPLFDFIPTATFGWLLVVVLGARPETRDDAGLGGASLFRSSLDPEREFAPGVRPPIVDRRAFQLPEPWLRKGSKPWED